jgi:hypothetical protein
MASFDEDPPSGPDSAPESSPPSSDSSPDSDDSADSDAPASLDTINDALEAVKATFPAESTLLADLRVDAYDDDDVFITAVVGGPHDKAYDHGPIDECIAEQFDAYGIGQTPYVALRPLALCLADEGDDSSEDDGADGGDGDESDDDGDDEDSGSDADDDPSDDSPPSSL